MTIRKQPNGKYLVEVYPYGRGGKRVRKTFATQAEAKRFEQHSINEAEQKPWLPQKDDKRKLSELIHLWHSMHGQSLVDGTRRLSRLKNIADMMGDPIAKNIKASDWSRYRQTRLEQVAIKTINNEQVYFNALFNELKRLGEWHYDNPITGIRPLKTIQGEMGFLTDEDIPALFHELKQSKNSDVYLVAKICLSTGCRWSEAEELKANQVTKHKLTFTYTKGNKNRTVPISEALFNELPKVKSGRLFSNCVKSFRMAVKRAGIVLPKGQMTHVLRHTFASHFMMNGGNILVLQQILGHASITDTMKYAHFSPTHLADAVKLNPFANSGGFSPTTDHTS